VSSVSRREYFGRVEYTGTRNIVAYISTGSGRERSTAEYADPNFPGGVNFEINESGRPERDARHFNGLFPTNVLHRSLFFVTRVRKFCLKCFRRIVSTLPTGSGRRGVVLHDEKTFFGQRPRRKPAVGFLADERSGKTAVRSAAVFGASAMYIYIYSFGANRTESKRGAALPTTVPSSIQYAGNRERHS